MAMSAAPLKVNIPTVEIRDFGHLMAEVSAREGVPPVAFWRGQLEGESLVPAVFRDPPSRPETRLALGFRQVAPARMRMGEYPRDDEHAKWLVLMQHSGLPTRLLDWSESPLVAAYFAAGADRGENSSAVVWRLDALCLNHFQARERTLYNIGSLRVQEFAGLAFSRRPATPDDAAGERGDGASEPGVIAMAPYHFSPQHVAQQSCFTLHRNGNPMEQRRGGGKFLKRFIIPARIKREIRECLAAVGVARHCLFPEDLRNLATVLRQRHEK